jgi:hypothetical protein
VKIIFGLAFFLTYTGAMAETVYTFKHASPLANINRVNHYDWGFLAANLNGSYNYDFPIWGGGYSNRYAKPNKQKYYAIFTRERARNNNIDIKNCKRYRPGNVFYGRKTTYRCFLNKKFHQDMAAYNKMKRRLTAKKWGAKLHVTGLNKTGTAINAKLSVTGHILREMLATESKALRSLIRIDIFKCMTDEGTWKKYDEIDTTPESLDIAALIDGLYETEVIRYIRCDLGVAMNELTTPILKGSVMTRTSNPSIGYSRNDEDKISLQIDDTSKYIIIKGRYENYKYVRSGKISLASSKELHSKIKEYIEFLKFDYGDVLLDLFEGNAPRAEIRLKVKGFFQKNKKRIKAYLKEIKALTNNSSLIDQVSASYSIAQAYQYIRTIEKKMRTRMTLDSIVESNID